MATADVLFTARRKMLGMPRSGVLSLTCLSQEHPPKVSQNHKARTGLQTDTRIQNWPQLRFIVLGWIGVLGLVMLRGRMRLKAPGASRKALADPTRPKSGF